MGAHPSAPLPSGGVPNAATSATSTEQVESKCPVRGVGTARPAAAKVAAQDPAAAGGGGCPVRGKQQAAATATTGSTSTSASAAAGAGASAYKNPNVYNVYSQKIDPTNQMPTNANQLPAEGQAVPLSVERVSSTIPKGGTDNETWTYPSPQMFWNALVRKNKTEGASEKDIDDVIAVHNNMNENTWQQVLAWEKIHAPPPPISSSSPSSSSSSSITGREPKLLRFLGRPHDLSPKAQLKHLFGHPLPFDRHDWIVDRGGKEVRYVIDYYHDESQVGKDIRPKHLLDAESIQSISVDVRPALDSVSAFIDLFVRMPALLLRDATTYNPPPFFAPPPMLKAQQLKHKRINQQWQQIKQTCAEEEKALSACESEASCAKASIALNKKMALVVCKDVVSEFERCASGGSGGSGSKKLTTKEIEQQEATLLAAYSDITKCLEMFRIDLVQAIEEQGGER